MNDQGKRYDLIAEGFAKMRDSFYMEQKFIDRFLEVLPKQASILDVGCGSGYPIASYIIDKGHRVTGLDSSEKLLAIAEKNCPSMQCILGDMRAIELKDTFDGIIEWWALFHIPKVAHESMIKRFASWLKPGGILQFTTGENAYEDSSKDMLNQELWFYSLAREEYEKYLEQHGFKILFCETDQPQHLVWMAEYTGTKGVRSIY